ncbi:uncharacterized mitochondrial protein AtMg00860-like [Aristolochia californica]|uniref:uncharacterized mitochondrial protein AtMg00860-like n=1 Tax=Aristolochia californica TaxID=171875 RepID=UPI0035DDEF52
MSKSRDGHLAHLRIVFDLLRAHQLYLKKSKCSFGASHVAYLGHIISHEGVTIDPEKIQAISEWPQPQSCSAVRGFLGLAGYYQKFIQSFDPLAPPLTNLLKKNSFQWNEEASTAFDALKNALASTRVLQLPNFDDLFVIECDASGGGIGVVLHQNSHPIAYFSRQLASCYQKLAAYECELIRLAKAVQHWWPYVWGLEYRAGRLNKVVDALSIRFEHQQLV